jgi:hypothetical protein
MGVDSRIILKLILKMAKCLAWTHLIQEDVKWRTPANAILNLWVARKSGIF